MGEEAQARQKKAQRVLAEAFAHAEVTASLEERAKLRANAKMEAELLINVCDYVQADMVRSSTRQLHMCRSCVHRHSRTAASLRLGSYSSPAPARQR